MKIIEVSLWQNRAFFFLGLMTFALVGIGQKMSVL